MAEIGDAVRGARKYLRAHPDEAAYRDSAATATIRGGLQIAVAGANGESLQTDMPPSVGGGGANPSPGWVLRAAHAACGATLIAMRAAEEGVQLTHLEVNVDSESDDRGILGADDSVPAGPIRTHVHVSIAADGTDQARLEEIVRWAIAHCPVDDAVRRAVPVVLRVEVSGPSDGS